MENDPELLRRYTANGSEAAFAELARRHLGLVYHAALRQLGGDAHGAADVAQSVFIDLARQAPKLAGRLVLASWLHTAVRFSAAKRRRSEQTRRAYEQAAEASAAALRETGPTADWERLRPWIDESLQNLTEADRDAVLLRFFSGCSFAEVGSALQLSEDAARMRVQRALAKLQGLLGRQGITSTASALGLLLADQAAAAAPAELAAGFAARTLATVSSLGPTAMAAGLSKASLGIGAGALALSLVSLGLVAAGFRQAWRDRTLVVQADQITAELGGKERTTQARLAALEEENVAQQEKTNQRSKAAIGEAEKVMAKPWDPRAEGDKFVARHPEVRKALDSFALASARWTYGNLVASFRLAPEASERVLSLLASGGSFGYSTPDTKQELQLHFGGQDPAGAQATLPDLLSPDQLHELRQAENTSLARDQVSMIAGGLWDTPTPLTPDQAEQLTKIIGWPKNGFDWDWSAIAAQAQSILSPAQVQAVANRRDGMAELRALNQ
ncbi:MAG TPA: sigma-70 family RNA polymerase sigma factor [Opitutaceae bacterium]|jgi:RNA polymerase sigma factor (sigma-70 family)|nr:sigma-70 family RNA polymerase sigma factor [Opitutaceae bacterium]